VSVSEANITTVPNVDKRGCLGEYTDVLGMCAAPLPHVARAPRLRPVVTEGDRRVLAKRVAVDCQQSYGARYGWAISEVNARYVTVIPERPPAWRLPSATGPGKDCGSMTRAAAAAPILGP
jgi:hypothetical protein